MAIYKQCSWHGCTKLIREDIKYCDYHSKKFSEQEKERYKEYSHRRKLDKEQKKYQDFYSSNEWKRLRDLIRLSCYGIDIVELYRTGRIVQGERVHHIIELEEDWNSRFDICNLIYLTEKNHRIIHSQYDKGKREKKQMQNILFSLLEKFNQEYL